MNYFNIWFDIVEGFYLGDIYCYILNISCALCIIISFVCVCARIFVSGCYGTADCVDQLILMSACSLFGGFFYSKFGGFFSKQLAIIIFTSLFL